MLPASEVGISEEFVPAWLHAANLFSMPKEQTLARIEREIAEGKLGIARDRLHGLVIAYPCDLSIRSRLGDVYARLGYPVYAGRFWYLDSDISGEKEEAVKAFMISCGNNPREILERLKVKCEPQQISDFVAAEKLESLIEECKASGLLPPQTSNSGTQSLSARYLGSFCLLVSVVLIVLIIVGLLTVITWIEQNLF